jgi:hypothetical protein
MVPVAAYFNTKEVPCRNATSRSILHISSDVAFRDLRPVSTDTAPVFCVGVWNSVIPIGNV